MTTMTPCIFGYLDDALMSRTERLFHAIPLIGSFFSIACIIEAIKGRTLDPKSEEIPTPLRIQYCIRGAFGLLPGVGLALIPIDLVATAVDFVRHAIHNRHARVPGPHAA